MTNRQWWFIIRFIRFMLSINWSTQTSSQLQNVRRDLLIEVDSEVERITNRGGYVRYLKSNSDDT